MAIEEIQIEGHLGQDPTRPSNNNQQLLTFSVAVSQSKKDKQTNEWVSTTTWYKVNSWNAERSKYLEERLKKGNKVVVKGRPILEQYQAKDGTHKANISILLDKIALMNKEQEGGDNSDNKSVQNHVTKHNRIANNQDFLDDEIPF
jgi:single-strand DNA-binding protein